MFFVNFTRDFDNLANFMYCATNERFYPFYSNKKNKIITKNSTVYFINLAYINIKDNLFFIELLSTRSFQPSHAFEMY